MLLYRIIPVIHLRGQHEPRNRHQIDAPIQIELIAELIPPVATVEP
jgi:hypothetical protein